LGDDELASTFKFRRTVPRLIEMQNEDYIANRSWR
jgi:predicted ATPase